MLETIREYGQECLAASGEADAGRRQHAEFFLALAEEAEPELWRDAAWLERLECEHDNLRAALDWCGESGVQAFKRSGVQENVAVPKRLNARTPERPTAAEIGLRLAGALWWFWDIRNHFTEARRRLETALAGDAGAGTPVRRKALCAAAYLEAHADPVHAAPLAEQSLALCRQAGDDSGMGWSLIALLSVSFRQQDYAAAQALAAEALSLSRTREDKQVMASALFLLGSVEWMQSQRENGEALLEECLALCRSAGYRWFSGGPLRTLAQSALDAGQTGRARALLEESLAITREFGIRGSTAFTLHALARLAQSTGDDDQATALFAESLAIFRSLGNAVASVSALVPLGDLALARAEFDRARGFFEEALALAREARAEPQISLALLGLASVAQALGERGRARALFEQAQPPSPEVGDRWLSHFSLRQGDWLLEFGDAAAARSRYEEGLARRRAGEYPGLIAHALLAVGHAAWCEQDHVAARSYALEALGLFQQQGHREGTLAALEIAAAAALGRGRNDHGASLAGAVTALRAAQSLPGAAWWRRPRKRMQGVFSSAAWEAGPSPTWEQTISLALEEGEPGARLSLPLSALEIDLPPGALALLPQGDLTEAEWDRIAPLLPASSGRRGRPHREHRRVIDGIRWKLRTGAAWRNLPARYGPWHTCHNRYGRWQREGLWDRITAALRSGGPPPD